MDKLATNRKSSRSSRAVLTALSIAILAAGGFAISRTATAAGPAIVLSSNAFPGKTYTLSIIQDQQGLIQQMVYQTDAGSSTVTVADLQGGKPQPLCNVSGHDVVFISADSDFNAQKGGHIEVRFITSAILGSYKNFRVLVDVQGDSVILRSDPDSSLSHSDKNSYTGVFNQLYVEEGLTHTGISKVIPSES